MRGAIFLIAITIASVFSLQLYCNDETKSKAPQTTSTFDFNKQSSLDFIAFLIAENNRGAITYVIKDPVKNWVKKEEVAHLMLLIDSNEKCSGVCLAASSHLSTEASTVGSEALFLINGYIKGSYPAGLNSTRHHLLSKEEIISWWEKNKQ